jgi:hypothetical protein
MPDPSPLVHELFNRLRLAPSVAAQVDWASGILRVNRGVTEWQEFFRNPQRDAALLRTLEHEAHHVVQISTLTYLYRFAISTHAAVAPLLNQYYGNLAGLPDTLGANAEPIKNLVWDLTWRDGDGLSVVDIVESLTYFSQYGAGRHASEYLTHLQRARVDEVYERGFLVFAKYTPNVANASAFFPIACHLSLCSWDPRASFVALAKAVADGRIGERSSLEHVLELCREADPSFPGFAWEFSRTLPPMPIRFTFAEVQTLLTQDAEAIAKLWPYFIDPGAHSLDFFALVYSQAPALLNPIADADYGDYRKWLIDMRGIRDFGAFTIEQRRMWPLFLAAVSRKYIEPIGSPPEGAVRVKV